MLIFFAQICHPIFRENILLKHLSRPFFVFLYEAHTRVHTYILGVGKQIRRPLMFIYNSINHPSQKSKTSKISGLWRTGGGIRPKMIHQLVFTLIDFK